MMTVYISPQELRQLLTDCPAKTQTYEVDVSVFRDLPRQDTITHRPMTDAEVAELAAYLGVSADLLVGPLEVTDKVCEHCGRQVTFLDFVKSGVEQGAHSQSALAAILTSREKAWVTIVGRDGGRDISCARCGESLGLRESINDDGYKSGAYDYRFPITNRI
jgi:hypothetical protein